MINHTNHTNHTSRAKSWRGLFLSALALAAGLASTQAARAQGSAPQNDDFELAQPFRSSNGSYLTSGFWYGNTSLATDQDDEPTHAGNYGGKSVWFLWVAPYSGTVTFTTAGSQFDTLLAAYRGTELYNLQRVASNDNASSRDQTSAIRFSAVAGASYLIAVDGYNDDDPDDADPDDAESGYYRLNISFGSNGGGNGSRPSNDDFFAPYSLGSTSLRTVRGSSLYATREAYEPSHAGRAGGRSVWFSWTAPYSGYVSLSGSGSSFSTLLAAYYGGSLSGLRLYGSGVNSARFYAVRGYTYKIALDGLSGASGNYALTLRQDSSTGV